MAADVLRIGLIGCGSHGRDILCPALATVPEAKLVACCDVIEAAARETAEEFGAQRTYSDYGEMLAREEMDAVIVSLPHHLLKDAAVAAAASGRHVFVEKPVASNRAEATEIREAAMHSGVTVMPGYCQRYAEGRRMTKELIDKGAVGGIVAVSAGKGSNPLGSWMADPKRGGGPLRWVGVHITDQILWMVGSEPVRVSAEIIWDSGTGVERDSTYTIRFESGVLASVVCSQRIGAVDFIEVFGNDGRVRAEWPAEYAGLPLDTVSVHSRTLPEFAHPTIIRPARPPGSDMYAKEMCAWVRSVIVGDRPPIGIGDGIRVLAVIDAVFESARNGRAVDLTGYGVQGTGHRVRVAIAGADPPTERLTS